MAGSSQRTPKSAAASNKKTPVTARKQSSLLSFFTAPTSSPASSARNNVLPTSDSVEPTLPSKPTPFKRSLVAEETPAPSSDPVDVSMDVPTSPIARIEESKTPKAVKPDDAFSSPPPQTRKRRTTTGFSYGESSDEENEAPVRPSRAKRRKSAILEESEDEFMAESPPPDDDDLGDFVVSDEEDDDIPMKKSTSKSKPKPAPKTPSRTQTYAFKPTNGNTPGPRTPAARNPPTTPATAKKTPSTKPSKSDERYPWLVEVLDADRNPPGHPDYDPRTLYIPSYAWQKFSPFEKQYWEIKSKFYDTVVFFKKGKFYELYEDDATIGAQEFDLKLTDRVNMRMVGVPESSLEMWAAQFIAKGYKIARVDQKESALAKEMRERDNAKGAKKEDKVVKKEDKIIKRELACVLTGGTLVEEQMLQDDMSTYCIAIKEAIEENLTSFGVCFVDTATGSFSMCQFEDDPDLTKFETLIAQIRPKELIVEKGVLSVKATRILKNNTSITTIWNKIKPEKEFWDARTIKYEMMNRNYFNAGDNEDTTLWPKPLQEALELDLAMSAFGALVWYLQSLKIDKELISLANFEIYDPIRKATSLVLDGKTLINLEIFNNAFDGSSAGTLFALLNRCITPFGKRMLRQWICHPLADASRINARLDTVEALNADTSFRDAFSGQLQRLPDLERLISRVHAGTSRPVDFCRVLEGFEQIKDAMNQLRRHGEGEGLIGKLVDSMPDLEKLLTPWYTAFDRLKAKDDGVMVPERGVEEDFDNSQDRVEELIAELMKVLRGYQKDFGCKDICFRDNGKEIYTIEVPLKATKSIPKTWNQMSATKAVKRYYSPEVKALVRQLQEAQETHSQIVKDVAGRLFARFDKDYKDWLAVVKIVAQLDCLISLAKASAALGNPSCRPVFVESERGVLDFQELRHPCMAPTVGEFIPNDVHLGGDAPNISLLTGANAAGKSTVLRMTCVAVIMAQIGCYVPASSATLTPVDRIMSRLGANDNIFAAQSTFFVELAETKKILSESTPRSLVILDELGRGTSSYDGVAVAQAVLHHVATHIGCLGFFATHYHSLASEFRDHPEVQPMRMAIKVDSGARRITFLYRLESGVAEGSFGMHCAAMCGIDASIIEKAEQAAKMFEHTSRLKEKLEGKGRMEVPLGWLSDFAWIVRGEGGDDGGVEVLRRAIESL